MSCSYALFTNETQIMQFGQKWPGPLSYHIWVDRNPFLLMVLVWAGLWRVFDLLGFAANLIVYEYTRSMDH